MHDLVTMVWEHLGASVTRLASSRYHNPISSREGVVERANRRKEPKFGAVADNPNDAADATRAHPRETDLLRRGREGLLEDVGTDRAAGDRGSRDMGGDAAAIPTSVGSHRSTDYWWPAGDQGSWKRPTGGLSLGPRDARLRRLTGSAQKGFCTKSSSTGPRQEPVRNQELAPIMMQPTPNLNCAERRTMVDHHRHKTSPPFRVFPSLGLKVSASFCAFSWHVSTG